MINLLMIVHTFPPRGSVGGSIRIIKFLKYLKELRDDIKFTILTIRDDIVLLNDPHLSSMALKDIPDNVKIIKTNTFQPRHRAEKAGKIPEDIFRTPSFNLPKAHLILKSIYVFIEKIFLIPDYAILWFPYSIKAAVKEIKNNRIDIIYATAPPFSVLVQSVIIKKITGNKLIIDIKDDWVHQTKFIARPFLIRKVEEKLERFCVKNAEKVILVTASSYNDFISRYPEYKRKFALITNGCDVMEFEKFWEIEHAITSTFTIIHSGIIANSRNPEGFFSALAELKNEGVICKTNFKMQFIGTLHRDILNIISNKKLDDIVLISEVLEREKYITELMHADLLLAFNYRIKTLIPGKLYDYWGSRRPVLLIDKPDSMASQFLYENKLGVVKDFEDVNGIKETIKKYFFLWKNGDYNSKLGVDNLFKYDRRNLTKQLIEIIDTI